jgi:hypothetical protein
MRDQIEQLITGEGDIVSRSIALCTILERINDEVVPYFDSFEDYTTMYRDVLAQLDAATAFALHKESKQ